MYENVHTCNTCPVFQCVNACECVCIYLHIHTHTYIECVKLLHAHESIPNVCEWTCTVTHRVPCLDIWLTHKHTRTHTHINLHSRIESHVLTPGSHTKTHAHTHTHTKHMHTHTHTHIHTYIHINMHTHGWNPTTWLPLQGRPTLLSCWTDPPLNWTPAPFQYTALFPRLFHGVCAPPLPRDLRFWSAHRVTGSGQYRAVCMYMYVCMCISGLIIMCLCLSIRTYIVEHACTLWMSMHEMEWNCN